MTQDILYLPSLTCLLNTAEFQTFLASGKFQLDLDVQQVQLNPFSYSVFQAPPLLGLSELEHAPVSSTPKVRSSLEHCLRLLDEHNFDALLQRLRFAYTSAQSMVKKAYRNPLVVIGTEVPKHTHEHDLPILTYVFPIFGPTTEILLVEDLVTRQLVSPTQLLLKGNGTHSVASDYITMYVVFDKVALR